MCTPQCREVCPLVTIDRSWQLNCSYVIQLQFTNYILTNNVIKYYQLQITFQFMTKQQITNYRFINFKLPQTKYRQWFNTLIPPSQSYRLCLERMPGVV